MLCQMKHTAQCNRLLLAVILTMDSHLVVTLTVYLLAVLIPVCYETAFKVVTDSSYTMYAVAPESMKVLCDPVSAIFLGGLSLI